MSSSCLLVLTSALAPAFPGPEYLRPTIHFTRDEVSEFAAWHDIAGAFTHRGVHHIYQGEGWNHAFSTDLVNWRAGPHGPRKEHETYAGMDSFSDPCSGFVTKDDEGVVCAGFRQCGSSKGVNKTNYHDWDVPLELRCALDDNLTAWNDAAPDYLFNVTFYRPVPYDPARPWREADGHYYVLLSFDHCNVTTKKLPCDSGGGMLVAWRSPALRGPKADWQYVGPVFSSNRTVIPGAHLAKEFVTIDYLGGLPGDPAASSGLGTRIFLNNVGGNGGGLGCCSGTTSFFVVEQAAPGAPLVEVAPQGMVDWGAFRLRDGPPSPPSAASAATAATAAWPGIEFLDGKGSRGLSMARTLGSEDADQVTKPGRRVLIGWTGPPDASTPLLNGSNSKGSAQSLPRDLSLGADRSLRQAFVPELRALRDQHMSARGVDAWFPQPGGLQAEVLAALPPSCATKGARCGVSMLGDGENATAVNLDTNRGLVLVDARSQGNYIRAGPLPPPLPSSGGYVVHAYVDHCLLELIVNNATALVVYVAPTERAGRVQLLGMPENPEAAALDVWTLKSAAHGRS